MKSKVIGMCLVLVVAVGLLTSCTTTKPGSHGGVTTALVEKDYDILGRVELTGTRKAILGFNIGGGATYSDLLDKAVKQYGADEVINVTLDHKTTDVGIFYVDTGWILTGLAIKYK